MKRRSFLQRLTAAAATAPWLLGATQELSGLEGALGASQDEAEFWTRVRSQFLMRPGLTHMNSATIGATPRPVVGALTDFLWETESDPQDHVFGAPHLRMDEVRGSAAEFLGASPSEVALMRNTTEGMNAVAQGMTLSPGDQILTTNHEHPGGSVCWEYVAEKTGAEIVRIEMPSSVESEDQILALVSSHLTPRTRVCSFSHVCTITGLVMPLARIAELTRPRGILLVCDGAQAPGMLDVDVHALGVDTYASSSHKWMLAPKGTGLLYIREGVQDQIRPLFLHSGYGAYTASSGTRNVATILAHGVAMDFHNTIGRGKVEARCRELQARLRSHLEGMDGLTILTPREEALCAGILTISLKSLDYRELRQTMLTDHGFVLKTGKAEYNAIRISTHIFNSEEDVDRLAEGFEEVLA
jgi:selenocysteine lyase/cysteine desulfurase